MDTKKLNNIALDKVILYTSIALFCTLTLTLFYYAPGLKAHFEGDSLRYHEIAHHLASLNFMPLEVLGYPTFLALLYQIYDTVFIVVLAQLLLSIFSLLMLRRIIRTITTDTFPLIIVTILWTLNLGFLIYTQLVLIEIILTLFLLVFIERVITYYQKPTYSTGIQAGLVLGLSILLRPAALFYALFFPILLLFLTKIPLYKRVFMGALFLCSFYVPVLAYMSFAYWYFGLFVLCPVMNINLFAIYYPKIQAAFAVHTIAPTALNRAIEADIAQHTITKTTQLNLIKLCCQHPAITIKIWLINMLKSLIGLYQTEWKLYFELSDHATSYFCLPGNWLTCLASYIHTGTTKMWLHLLGWFELIYLIIEYCAVTIGSLVLLKNNRYWLICFALSFIGYFACITGPDGSGRFRMMLEPWLLILATLGITWLLTRNNKKVIA